MVSAAFHFGREGQPLRCVSGRRESFKKIEAVPAATSAAFVRHAENSPTVPSLLLGGFWTSDDTIVFAAPNSGLMQVPAAGGQPSPFLNLDAPRGGTTSHGFPSLLPDGRTLHLCGNNNKKARERWNLPWIVRGHLASGAQRGKRLLADVSAVAYAPSPDPALGYILFVRPSNAGGSATNAPPGGTLMAQPFDNRKLELAGDAVPVATEQRSLAFATFSASATGVLVYGTGALRLPPQQQKKQRPWPHQLQRSEAASSPVVLTGRGKWSSTVGEPDVCGRRSHSRRITPSWPSHVAFRRMAARQTPMSGYVNLPEA